jgi:pimeloyl-ACP methyl ester carboxylesterase
MKTADIKSKQYRLNNINIHVIEAGPEAGMPMIFLHGFPDFWYGWKDQIAFFADCGYRVIVPDQRGYHLSGKPKGVKAYRCKHLMDDILSLIELLDLKDVHLVGHDWGGIVSWLLGIYHPQQFKTITILNAPHPGVLRKRISPKQILRSWYIYLFQLPWIPEWLFGRNNFKLLRKSMLKMALPGTFSTRDMERYTQAWKGSLKTMINWYRAIRVSEEFKENLRAPKKVSLPLLMLWGKQDLSLDFSLAMASMDFASKGKMQTFPDATHWLQHEKSAEVNRAILNFIKKEER